MANLGKYDPTRESHSSSLFIYGEVPVSSAKLNRWNANIDASLEAVNLAVSRLVNSDQNAVLDTGCGGSLRVAAQPTPNMTVRILTGVGIIHPYVVAKTTVETLPGEGMIEPPVSASRIDVVYARRDGESGIVTGAEDSSPVAPGIPTGAMALAEIYLRPGCTAIKESDDGLNGYLVDLRKLVTVGPSHRHSVDQTPPEVPDGETVHFSTALPFRLGTLEVFLNGVMQAAAVDYTEEETCRGYIFHSPPPAVSIIQHRYLIKQE
ncbi:MAG TPA: hypothetical protein PLQ35_10055 [bacterium]|nr:hypothetical protein [bacterium]HQL62626.1 hypothetical protein [bacterium]